VPPPDDARVEDDSRELDGALVTPPGAGARREGAAPVDRSPDEGRKRLGVLGAGGGGAGSLAGRDDVPSLPELEPDDDEPEEPELDEPELVDPPLRGTAWA